MDRKRWLGTVLLGLIVCPVLLWPSAAAAADQQKYRNPNPVLQPVPPEVEQAMAEGRRGPQPELTPAEREKLDAGEVVTRTLPVTKTERGLRYEALGTIEAGPAAVSGFLRDYPARIGVFPHLTGIAAEWQGNRADVDITMKVALTTLRYRMRYLHWGDAFIEWEYLNGDIRDTSGSYRIWPLDGGRRTLLAYRVYTDTGMAVPKFILNLLTRNSLPGLIEAVRTGVRARSAPAA